MKIYLLLFFLILTLHAEEVNIILEDSIVEYNRSSFAYNPLILDNHNINDGDNQNLDDVLRKVSGVDFVDFGLGKNIDIRGQGKKANIGVKVIVDGKNINNLDSTHGITNLDILDLDNIEKIEIIPGGGAVLYGSGTRGGSVIIKTKDLKKDYFSILVKNSFSDRHRFLNPSFSSLIAKKITDNLFLNFNFGAFNENLYRDEENKKGYFVNSKFIYDIDDLNIKLNYNYYSDISILDGYLTKKQVEENPRSKGDSQSKIKTKIPELSLEINKNLNDKFDFKALLFARKNEKYYVQDYSFMKHMGMKAKVDQSGSFLKDDIYGVRLENKFNYTLDSYIIFGYEFAKHTSKRKNIVFYKVPPVINYHKMTTLVDMQKQNHSLFAFNSHSFNDYFFLNSGLRYEYSKYSGDRTYLNQMSMNIPPQRPPKNELTNFSIDKKHKNNIAFEISPNFMYSDSGNLYLKYERGFIAPSPTQFISKDAKKGYYESNLDSEVFDTFEIGVNDYLLFSDVNINVFYTLSDDEISYIGNPHSNMGSFWKYYNIDQTKRIGSELSLAQNFDNFSFYQNLSYIDAKISKGINKNKKIPYVSKFKAAFGMDYKFKNYKFFTNFNYYSRAKDAGIVDENTGKMSNNAWMRDYFLTNIGINYEYKNTKIGFGIKNLFDEKYYTYQNTKADEYLVGNGRNYYMDFKYAF
ncbi:TonB-dependent receptor [Campylobacter volucris]|uniref:TonB-dependent receptor n=2 Tax=Campylobacter volucris TaxID=1031542 RepID=UPI00189D0EA1|nr:TonB-dependent receptor [Campylobacter volucris]MBF7042077.1 TonB-dependent receptor [Campylobacter volucris]